MGPGLGLQLEVHDQSLKVVELQQRVLARVQQAECDPETDSAAALRQHHVQDASCEAVGELGGEEGEEPGGGVDDWRHIMCLQVPAQPRLAAPQQLLQLAQPQLEGHHAGEVEQAQAGGLHEHDQGSKCPVLLLQIHQQDASHKRHALAVAHPRVVDGVRVQHPLQLGPPGGGLKKGVCRERAADVPPDNCPDVLHKVVRPRLHGAAGEARYKGGVVSVFTEQGIRVVQDVRAAGAACRRLLLVQQAQPQLAAHLLGHVLIHAAPHLRGAGTAVS